MASNLCNNYLMINSARDPALFIGSSSEGHTVAETLQMALEESCESTVWSQEVFGPGDTRIASLVRQASISDFAVLVLTPDDQMAARGGARPAPRDNVIFELGLFMGRLTPERVFMVEPRGIDLRVPADLAGVKRITYQAYRNDSNLAAALGPAVLQINTVVKALGLFEDRGSFGGFERRGLTLEDEEAELVREVDALVKNVESQGWTVKTRSSTALRIVGRNGQRYSLPLASASEARDAMRPFARELKAAGLRVSGFLLEPPRLDV